MGIQKVNAQAQAGTANHNRSKGFPGLGFPPGLGSLEGGGGSGHLDLDLDIAAAESEGFHKDVRVITRAKKGSNAQGQGQIVQADKSIPVSAATAKTGGKKKKNNGRNVE